MTEGTRAKKAILNAFTRGKLTLSAGDLERVRVEERLSKDAFNRARSELRLLGWIERTRESNDPHAAVLWVAQPERMFGRNTSHIRRQDSGKRTKSAIAWRKEIARTIATDDDVEAFAGQTAARLNDDTAEPALPQPEPWCQEYYGGGGGRCRRCKGLPEDHKRVAPSQAVTGIRLSDLAFPNRPRFDD